VVLRIRIRTKLWGETCVETFEHFGNIPVTFENNSLSVMHGTARSLRRTGRFWRELIRCVRQRALQLVIASRASIGVWMVRLKS